MASPFHVFRRHQKVLMATACVLGIFAFVLDDTLQSLVGGSTGGGSSQDSDRPRPNAVAVHWNGGQLTNAELDQLVFRRRVVNAFLKQILEFGFQQEQIEAMTKRTTPKQLTIHPVIGPDTPQRGVERDVVRVRLYADAARAMGMSVSDDEIRNYLNELGFGHVSPAQMQNMVRPKQSGHSGMSAESMFNAIREELLAHYYSNSHAFASAAVMPEQQWEDWLRVNDRVKIEAAGLPVESFLVDVKEPTDAELGEFYEKFKNDEPMPHFVDNVELPSPNPAFRIPRKIEVQYVRADFAKLLDKLKKEITDEEVQKYYDDKKDPYYKKLDTSLLEKDAEKKPDAEADAKQDAGPAKPADATDAAGKMPDATKSGDKTDAPTTQPPATTGDNKQQPAQPASGAAPTPPTRGTTPAQTTRGTTPASRRGSAPSGKSPSASQSRRSVFQLASFEQQTASTKTDATPATATPQRGEAGSTRQGLPQAPAGATSAAPAPANAAAPKTDQPTVAPTQTVTDKPAEPPQKPVEFMPLDDKLRDDIRRLLAEPKVQDRLDQLITQLQSELTTEFKKHFRAAIAAQEAKLPPPPAPPALADLSALAAQHELEYRKIDPVSQLELRADKVVGQLMDVEHSSQQQIVWLFVTLFSKEVEPYKPIVTVDVDNNRYIIMKSSDTPARVPPLDEVRDAVAKAWRLDKASGVALKHAEEMAKKAQDAATPLTEFFASDPTVKVVRTDLFAWLTGGEVSFVGRQPQQQPYRMSQPDDIVAADQPFMKTVFDLDEGKVAAVLNHNHSTAYILRVTEHEHSEDKLHEMYLGEASMWLGQTSMNRMHVQEAYTALSRSAREAIGYVEDRPLDPPDRRDE